MFLDADQKFLNFILNFFKGVSRPPPANLAQSVERAPFKRVAVGSIPTVGMAFASFSSLV